MRIYELRGLRMTLKKTVLMLVLAMAILLVVTVGIGLVLNGSVLWGQKGTVQEILEQGQLAKLPQTAQILTLRHESLMFGYTNTLSFKAPMEQLDQWVNECRQIAPLGSSDEATSGSQQQKYDLKLKEPGRGHTGSMEIYRETGIARVVISIIDCSL